MDKQHYINMFNEEERDSGIMGLYPFCVGVISAIVDNESYTPDTALDEIKKALEALEIAKGGI